MTQEYQIQAHGEDAMVALGKQFGQALAQPQHGCVVFLQGNLGMGKTTFTRGVLRHFGYQGAAKSPTYTLVEPYQLGSQRVNHFDLYRLGHGEELEYLGIRDYFDEHAINVIEWPDKGAGYLPAADVEVSITSAGRGRSLAFVAGSKLGSGVIGQLQQQLQQAQA
jgi:tRNA threonylcarbamoyladenosine biosynthesis protein TsaE